MWLGQVRAILNAQKREQSWTPPGLDLSKMPAVQFTHRHHLILKYHQMSVHCGWFSKFLVPQSEVWGQKLNFPSKRHPYQEVKAHHHQNSRIEG